MKSGDFVNVHLESGCVIGKLISINEETATVTVEFGGGLIMSEIPKSKCTLWVSI